MSDEKLSAMELEHRLAACEKENAELRKLLPDFGPADRRHVGDVLEENRALKNENQTLREQVLRLEETISYLPKVPMEPYEKEVSKRAVIAEKECLELHEKVQELESELGFETKGHKTWKQNCADAYKKEEQLHARITALRSALEKYESVCSVIRGGIGEWSARDALAADDKAGSGD